MNRNISDTSLSLNKRDGLPVDEGKIVINVDKISDKHFSRNVAKLISKWTGRIWQVMSSDSNLGQTLQEEDLIQQQTEIKLMQSDSDIQKILKKFPGSMIHSISPITETIDEKIEFNDKITKEK